MEQTTAKLRNFRSFLANRSLRKSKSSKQNASHGHLESTIQASKDNHDDTEEYLNRRTSQANQNSASMFDLVDPPVSSSRPTSMALSVNLNIHAIHDSYSVNNFGKSVSMHGLSSNDCRPTSSAITQKSQYSSSRNPAVKLFNTIRAKLGIKKKDRRHNKIVDNANGGFGSYFSSPTSSSTAPTRRESLGIQCDNLILSSSRSQDNILSCNGRESSHRVDQMEVDGEGCSGGPRLQRSATSTISSPQINCVGVNKSPSASDTDRVHSRTTSQNESSETCVTETSATDELKPAIPVKQRAVRGATSHSSSKSSNENRDKSKQASSPLKGSLTKELCDLLHYGWYWGGMSKDEAEDKLKGEPDGAFVVRDSSSDHYLLSLSFNSNGKTLHTRIEYRNGKFCFYSSETESFGTVAELIDYWVQNSEQGTFCYSRSRQRNADVPSYPVRLSKPISRFTEVKTLAHLSRFVIRQYTRVDLIPQLPLPQTLIDFVGQHKYI